MTCHYFDILLYNEDFETYVQEYNLIQILKQATNNIFDVVSMQISVKIFLP